jgi:hypothetical protein
MGSRRQLHGIRVTQRDASVFLHVTVLVNPALGRMVHVFRLRQEQARRLASDLRAAAADAFVEPSPIKPQKRNVVNPQRGNA